MKTCTYLLAFWLAAAALPLEADEAPVVFARSGQKAKLPVGGGARGTVALWAFGQRWGEPVTAKDNAAEFVAPNVRVPVAFELISGRDARIIPGELVVYPDRPIHWDKDVQLAAVGIPDWFGTWSKAVGLPVTLLQQGAAFDAGNWRQLEKPGLLILGGKAAGKGVATVQRLAMEHKTGVLVLEADWFGKLAATRTHKWVPAGYPEQPFAVAPKQLVGPLADWQRQQWALPPTFRQSALPWPGISNRQTWIAGAEYPRTFQDSSRGESPRTFQDPSRGESPLVEEIRSPLRGTESQRIVLSYLPWQEQLGRSEIADELFLRLLTETARRVEGRPPLEGWFCLLYPPAKAITAAQRPVLAAALRRAVPLTPAGATAAEVAMRRNPPAAFILDVRGKTPPSPDFFAQSGDVKAAEGLVGPRTPLLILGDSPVLDSWKWLKMDRLRERSPAVADPRPGVRGLFKIPVEAKVLWWRDSSLPPSLEAQLRLMQLFTEWNIFLGDNPQEVSNDNSKNGP